MPELRIEVVQVCYNVYFVCGALAPQEVFALCLTGHMAQTPSFVASGDLSRFHDLLGSLEPGRRFLYQQEILWLAAKEGRIEVLQWLQREGCRIEFEQQQQRMVSFKLCTDLRNSVLYLHGLHRPAQQQ